MTDPLDRAFVQIQRAYVSGLPALVMELRKDVSGLREGSDSAARSLKARLHRLVGSGASHGFPELSDIAREMERLLANDAGPEPTRLEQAVARLESVVRRVSAQLGPRPDAAEPTWRALLILPPGPDRDRVVQSLEVSGYSVKLGSRRDDPATVEQAERPDLVVIGLGPGEGDPSAVASSWTNRRGSRPRAVVLIETLRAVDRLRAIAAGVDAVVPIDRMVEDVPRYARTLARTGAPPSSVLLVEPDAARAAKVSEALSEANIKVVTSPAAQAVQELLDREVPDLLMLSTGLAEVDAYTISRMVRQDPRFHLLPIVFFGPLKSTARVEALRAGADDFLEPTVDPEVLLQTVVTRAERGRRLRERFHRDDLTGLLNHSTLMVELDCAVEYCRRHGGQLAFVVFDLDRFGEVNERFGQLVGDQVLLHIANVFRASVRASDVIGRYAGEEFGMLLRGSGSDGAAVVAKKLKKILGEQAATTAEGVIIPLNVSVGWAAFPADGTSAGELAHAAVRALRREKEK